MDEKRAFEEMPFMVPFAASTEDTTETETHSAAESSLEKIADIYQNGDRPNEGTFYDETPFMTASMEKTERIADASIEETVDSDKTGENEANLTHDSGEDLPFLMAAAAEKPTELEAAAEEPVLSGEAENAAWKSRGQTNRKIYFSREVQIQDLPLSPRSKNCLCRAGIITLEQLIVFDRDKLCGIRNLGAKSAVEIMEFLDDLTSEKQENEEAEENAM